MKKTSAFLLSLFAVSLTLPVQAQLPKKPMMPAGKKSVVAKPAAMQGVAGDLAIGPSALITSDPRNKIPSVAARQDIAAGTENEIKATVMQEVTRAVSAEESAKAQAGQELLSALIGWDSRRDYKKVMNLIPVANLEERYHGTKSSKLLQPELIQSATPLMLAVTLGLDKAVDSMIKAGANVNAGGSGLLNEMDVLSFCAFMRDDDSGVIFAKIVTQLLNAGAKVNTQNKHHIGVFKRAAEIQDTKLVSLMIEKGADVNARDAMGESVLTGAVRGGDRFLVSYLLTKQGALATAHDLHICAEEGQSKSGKYADMDSMLRMHMAQK